MGMSDDDLRGLRDLPDAAPSAALDARVLRRAHDELRRQQALSRLALVWTRVALPAALAAAAVGYLRWALDAAGALHR